MAAVRFTLACCLIFAAAGCKTMSALDSASMFSAFSGSGPELPSWVKNPQCADATLCAVGSGIHDQYARKDAYKALAESLSVEIDSVDKLTSIQDGKFIRESQEMFLSLQVSDVTLTQASVVQQDRVGSTSYVMLQIAKTDLKDQLGQELSRLTAEVAAALKDNAAENFDDWWELRKRLADIRIISRNTDMLENMGEPRNQSADVLVDDYFRRFHQSYQARQLTLNVLGDAASERRLKNLLSQQFKAHSIDIVDDGMVNQRARLEVLFDTDGWQVGSEKRVAGTLWLRLKSSQGQTLAEFSLKELGFSLQSAREAKQMAVNKLISQLRQKNAVAELIN